MLQKIKLVLGITLFSIFLNLSINTVMAQDDTIRVGLFYQSQALPNFSVSSDSGIQFSDFKDNAGTGIFEDKTNIPYVVRKDSNCHIGIVGNYKTYKEALNYAESIIKLGIPAYVTFTENYEVWAGHYSSSQLAKTDIAKFLKIVPVEYRVIEPSDKSVVIDDASGSTKLLYAGTTGCLQVKPLDSSKSIIKINTKAYRGTLEVLRQKGSDMTVVNILNIEDYLYGVVPYEIGSDSHMEALKAQAVAARTYAYNNLKKHEASGFNLCSDVHCQVYKGVMNETPTTNKAVDETKGKKLMYEGKYAQVFYFSSSGGYTEDAVNVWGMDFPYLHGVEDKFESGKSTNYIWEKTFTVDKLSALLNTAKVNVGNLLGINIKNTSESGRVTELAIKGTNGEKSLSKSACRSVFELPSQMYTITNSGGTDVYLKSSYGEAAKASLGSSVLTSDGLKSIGTGASIIVMDGKGTKKVLTNTVSDGYKFSGRGWGHGVGMSQEGAKGMASAGYTYEEILKHYFQGTTVE